jgi:hypothetical protein
MPKPNSIYSYNLGKANGVGSSGNVYSFTNRQNGGLGPAAYFPNRNIVEKVTPPTQVVSQLTEYVGEYNGEYYVALLFLASTYDKGINDVINLFINQFPNTKLNFIKYMIDANLSNLESCLTEFTNLHSNSNKVIISEQTDIVTFSHNFIKNKNLQILNISVSSTSRKIWDFKNTITYSYYLNGSISTSFYIMKDYNVQNIVVIYDNHSNDNDYITNYRSTINLQNSMLDKIKETYYIFDNSTNPFDIPNNSIVYLLAETSTIKKNIERIKSSFINNTTSFIFMPDNNYDMEDIFEDIPAMVSLLVPSLYTKTTDIVYQSIKNKSTMYYAVYAFYDILYTLNYCCDNKIFITKKTYINVNPFKNIPPAWHSGYSILDGHNGFMYSIYDLIFTKDIIIDNDRVLYDLHNKNGSIARLPNSRSIFKTIGIFPNLPTVMVYLDREYIKMYENNVLKYVKFDSNNTIDTNGLSINSIDTSDCNFFVLFSRTTYFLTTIQKIFDNKKLTYSEVNKTMSKKYIEKYF